MHAENSIVIDAPPEKIFSAAADLSSWPSILPHYRYVAYLQRSPSRNIVRMAARRGPVPVRWTAEQVIDPERREVRFRHLTAFTKGMAVVWTFTPVAGGILVRIRHDLAPRFPLFGRLITDNIIGRFFVSPIANKTLHHMKSWLEGINE